MNSPETTYVGIDPGFTGGIGVIYGNGSLEAFDMPVKKMGQKSYNALDIMGFVAIAERIIHKHESRGLKKMVWAIENVQTRPDESPERSFRFGRGLGNLEGVLHAMRCEPTLIASRTWTDKFGFSGKNHHNAMGQRLKWFNDNFPQNESLVTGPRGGILSGRLDALCIAAYIKLISSTPLGKWGKRPPKFYGAPDDQTQDGLF